MVEIERNPLAVRQGAAAVVCIAAAAVAMPAIAYRAAEQRDGAEMAARSSAFQAAMQQQAESGAEPSARVELTAFPRGGDGLRARGAASLFENANPHAMLVQAALRGPLPPSWDEVRPARAALNPRELDCLSQTIYYEARGEAYNGQVAVAEVVMNRVRSRAYPNSICAVVYQGSHRATGCQFTFTCDGSLNQRPRGRAWETSQRVAELVMKGHTRPVTQRATHYHTNAINPVWSSGLVETSTIGSHVFYRFPNSVERPLYQQALARRRGGARHGEPAQDIIPQASEAVEAIEAATIEPAPEVAAAAPEAVAGEEVAT